ncbi:MAG TPA: DUF5668 domain-containing protein [Spirillospora sp.]|nr:DUF5668 domain-containing protein [Spirillospora sp.]
MQARPSHGPWLWPLALVVIGVVLLLDNFLLLGDFNVTLLWPLILVVAGAQVLLQGDLLAARQGKTFGITRGSVEAAALEISAGEIDVNVRGLRREGRLIAGQFASDSRPQMQVHDTQAQIKMSRAATPWLSFADWEMGLARDIPWQIFVTTHLGQVQLDLSEVIVQDVIVGTGFGDIRLTCPYESLGMIRLHSTLGTLQVIAPHGYKVRVNARRGLFFGVHADPARYTEIEPGVYLAQDSDEDAPLVEVYVSGTFGDAYLA